MIYDIEMFERVLKEDMNKLTDLSSDKNFFEFDKAITEYYNNEFKSLIIKQQENLKRYNDIYTENMLFSKFSKGNTEFYRLVTNFDKYNSEIIDNKKYDNYGDTISPIIKNMLKGYRI